MHPAFQAFDVEQDRLQPADIGFSDAVTGAGGDCVSASARRPAPRLRAYPVTTVVAEKFQVFVLLGIANRRLKDFYDLWLIKQTFEFDRAPLTEAVCQTFARRETVLPTEKPIGLGDANGRQWPAFLRRERMSWLSLSPTSPGLCFP